jgi:hypothetical protein
VIDKLVAFLRSEFFCILKLNFTHFFKTNTLYQSIHANVSFFIKLNIKLMGLLGKTLKGRSARPGGLPPKQNIKIRQIAKTQD